MTHAFDGGAFDDVAFDVGDVTPVVGGYAAANMFTFPPVKVEDDDDLLLAAWFMFMRQPYEN
jgi:hypothetical protein